jgi:hypothetical protein
MAGTNGSAEVIAIKHSDRVCVMGPNFSRRSFLGATASGAALSVAAIAPAAAEQRLSPLEGLATISLNLNRRHSRSRNGRLG